MTRFLLAGAVALTMTTGSVLAQGLPSDSTAAPSRGPTETQSTTKDQHIIDSNGAVIDKTKRTDSSQSFSSGDGQLSAHSAVKTGERTTVTSPPQPTVSTSTTTTEEVQH